MRVRYWQPSQEIDSLRHQLDRLFADLANTAQDGLTTAWVPAIELQETEQQFLLRVQLPGIQVSDLDIQATREAVSISGHYPREDKTSAQGFLKSEFRQGAFHRVVPLRLPIQPNHVQADYRDGILHLTLPKAPEVVNTVVKVNLTQPTDAPQE